MIGRMDPVRVLKYKSRSFVVGHGVQTADWDIQGEGSIQSGVGGSHAGDNVEDAGDLVGGHVLQPPDSV